MGTTGLFPGRAAAWGRGAGGRASFPQPVPRQSRSACRASVRVDAGGVRVAGPGQPNSVSWDAAAWAQLGGPLGLHSRQLLFVLRSYAYGYRPSLFTHPPFWHLRLPFSPWREAATSVSWKSWGNLRPRCVSEREGSYLCRGGSGSATQFMCVWVVCVKSQFGFCVGSAQ